jgi:hypothetical protein
MSDNGPHHPIAEAMRTAHDEAQVRERLNAPHGGPRSSYFGQGIGNVGGWVWLFVILGALLGWLTGHGLTGAVIGAVVIGGAFALIAFVGKITSHFWNRGPVWVWVLLGAIVGFFLGGVMSGEGINWAMVGMMVFGAFRYMMKD